MTRWNDIVPGPFNFHPISTISISYESCDLQASYDTLIWSLRLFVWPHEVTEEADGNVRKIIGENSGFVNF